VGVVSAGPKPEVGVVCSWISTNQNLCRRTFLHYWRNMSPHGAKHQNSTPVYLNTVGCPAGSRAANKRFLPNKIKFQLFLKITHPVT